MCISCLSVSVPRCAQALSASVPPCILRTMEGQDFAQLALGLCQVSRSLTDDELDQCVQVGVCIEKHMMDEAEGFVRRCQDEPLLVCYMCDGWSCDLTSRSLAFVGSRMQKKTNHWKGEFLLERAILRSLPSPAGDRLRMVMTPPSAFDQRESKLECPQFCIRVLAHDEGVGPPRCLYHCVCARWAHV